MPSPSAAKIASAGQVGKVKASPSDAPMKGAVHGAATATASTPVSAWSHTGWLARTPATSPGSIEPISKTPARFKPMRQKSAANAATTIGLCSWKPQPSCSPPARSASSNAARAMKDSTTPTV